MLTKTIILSPERETTMNLSKKDFAQHIKDFSLRLLFNEMGWDNDKTKQPFTIDGEMYALEAVAHKRGLKILTCRTKTLPGNDARRKLDAQIKKLFYHYILVCADDEGNQRWIIPIKKTEKRDLATIDYAGNQAPDFLHQKVGELSFSLEQEDALTIVDVSALVNAVFSINSEKVTKQFYESFKKEHSAFIGFIAGMEAQTGREWYASLMLNRLMFCYFIQKKGFLDGNKNYLADRLKACRQQNGGGGFYSFYRSFLLVLFHEGLNGAKQLESVKALIGQVPYLNGGLFDLHDLEKENPDIDIEDAAFERLFAFFDQYEWHLDTRSAATGKDINPDVIGYIFEKYINDRAQMGAYYTKEDITDYIGKNCIIPYLFGEVKRRYAKAFAPAGELWQGMKNSGDRYIYPAVKHGLLGLYENQAEALPQEIAAGIADTALRADWNKPAPPAFALPTEIWRETVERRSRAADLFAKIAAGDVSKIEDLITYNLDIRLFAQDAIENTQDPEFLKHFWKSLSAVTIIDPTCGSGAFLFAALNILEPLYEACLAGMGRFAAAAPGKHKLFEELLAQTRSADHPNLQYFIYKSIILRNLYGVDIMREATEIAKLRLFLKLVSCVEAAPHKPNMGLEPLPDIDFNIRAGNTLVGFATETELKQGLKWQLNYEGDEEKINEKCDLVAKAFARYKDIQLAQTDDFQSFKLAKDELNERLKALNAELNALLHKQAASLPYDQWLRSHQPFHWFAEFYEIINGNGGFDVVIGNPPYLEVKQIDYDTKGLQTHQTGAVHNMCIERSLNILKSNGNISMIVPLALVCTQRMAIVQNIIEKNRTAWYANFAWRPGKLFDNVNRALTIFVATSSDKKDVFSTNYAKWSSDTREYLFFNINFINYTEKRNSFWIPKLSNKNEYSILNKILKSDGSISLLMTKLSSNRVYYRATGGLYWKIFTNYPPKFNLNGKEGSSSREVSFAVKESGQDVICIAILSSNVFWWWYTVASNLRDLNPIDIQGFKFPKSILSDKKVFDLGQEYLLDLEKNSTMLTRIQKQTGETQTQSFKISHSKPIIDEIDRLLALHYGFSPEELDFIINYDIKYRMGKELEEEE